MGGCSLRTIRADKLHDTDEFRRTILGVIVTAAALASLLGLPLLTKTIEQRAKTRCSKTFVPVLE